MRLLDFIGIMGIYYISIIGQFKISQRGCPLSKPAPLKSNVADAEHEQRLESLYSQRFSQRFNGSVV